MESSDLEIVQYVRDAQAGSIDGMTALYEEYSSRVWAHIHRTTGGDRATTDDIHGDVWETVVRKIGTFDPERALFVTWLFRIASNRAVSLSRRAGVQRANKELLAHVLAHGTTEVSSAPGPEDVLVGRAEVERVRALVLALPRRQREAVLLTEFDGLSSGDAAAILGCSPAALWTAKSKALATLRKHLGKVGGKAQGPLRVQVVVAHTTASEPAPSAGSEPTLEG